MKIRLDQLIVQQGHAPSRTKAQELLERGAVRVYVDNVEKHQLKASDKFDLKNTSIEISDSELLKYVSRAGLKLEGALKQLNISVKALTCLDVGQSTGGFTDCLLQHGAKQVDGFDVGERQLADKLKQDPRVRYFEKLNAKDLSIHPEISKAHYDLIVVDVSFISIIKVLPYLVEYIKPTGLFLILVKPQYESFEAENRLSTLREMGEVHGFHVLDLIASPLRGRDGTQEYFLSLKA